MGLLEKELNIKLAELLSKFCEFEFKVVTLPFSLSYKNLKTLKLILFFIFRSEIRL